MKPQRLYCLALVFALLVDAGLARGDVYRIDRKSQWQEWEFPAGTLQLRADGSVVPMEFEGEEVNAALDASQFSHPAEGGKTVQGGVQKVGSNPAAGENLIDGDFLTFWKPDAAAPLEDWLFEIDLGRAVPVTRIRLVFPDREGARPFREFRIFGSSGEKVVSPSKDIFSFYLIGGTTRPNEQTEMEFEIRPIVNQVALNIGETGGENSLEVPYTLLQYIRFRTDAKSPDAALSEVEVYTFGKNIALGTLDRGGSIIERVGNGSTMVDGDVNTSWIGRDDREQGRANWVWDLGSLFWIERIAVFARETGDNTYGSASGIQNHQILASNGRQNLTGEISYDLLSEFDVDFENPGQLAYLFFPPRPLRYLSSVYTGGQSGTITEVAVFPAGYVAQVEMTSGNIDLGEIAGDNRPKVIESIEWQADLPPETRVQVQTRSGNTLEEAFLYYKKGGKPVSQQEYDKLPKPLRGKKVPIIQQGEDWSNWSTFSQVSGEGFRSPSPRRYVQVGLLLSSDQVGAAPLLNSLSINYTPALLAASAGEILPREVVSGVPQTFSYRILPQFKAGDAGFDRMLFETPSPIGPDSLFLAIAGSEIEPAMVRISPDSLVVELPQAVRRDTVEVNFRLTVVQNPTVFRAFLGNSQRAGLWQPVDPAGRFSTTVFLPAIPESDRLIANLSIQPRVMTPNGDGVGDQTKIRFLTPKGQKPAKVRIYALNGELVQELEVVPAPDQARLYLWSGRDQSGALVLPGNYLCRIGVQAQTGENVLMRVIGVAY